MAEVSARLLAIDGEREIERIANTLRAQVLDVLRRRGIVLGLSGGVDSSVVAALAVRAVGADRVLGLLMPDRDSPEDALRLGRLAAAAFGVPTILEDVTPAITALGGYARQSDAIRTAFPEYGPGWRSSLPFTLDGDRVDDFCLTVRTPDGEVRSSPMAPSAYRELAAATHFKRRVRKTIEYYHADRLRYAVAGTSNKLEHDQGFFVKNGDGAADVEPIAHLYKTQVYALAERLGVPEEIRQRPPTTDTYALDQTQEEPFIALSHDRMDLCLYGRDHAISPSDLAPLVGLSPPDVERVYREIDGRRHATRYSHEPPLLVPNESGDPGRRA